jgi:hypothetical protein
MAQPLRSRKRVRVEEDPLASDAHADVDSFALCARALASARRGTAVVAGARRFRLLVDVSTGTRNAAAMDALALLVRSAGPESAFAADSAVQLAATRALSCAAETDLAEAIVDGGGVTGVVALLTASADDVRFEATWCVGNLAAHSARCRDALLNAAAATLLLVSLKYFMDASARLTQLTPRVERRESAQRLDIVVWALGNLYLPASAAARAASRVAPTIRVLVYVCSRPESSQDMLVSATRGLAGIAAFNAAALGEAPDALSTLARLLAAHACCEATAPPDAHAVDIGVDGSDGIDGASRIEISRACVDALGNALAADDDVAQRAIECGAISALCGCIDDEACADVRTRACWALSNIASGTAPQRAALAAARLAARESAAQSDALLTRLAARYPEERFATQKEIAWIFANLCSSAGSGDLAVLRAVCCAGGVATLCRATQLPDPDIVVAALEALHRALLVWRECAADAWRRVSGRAADESDASHVAQLVEECGGVEAIEALQEHASEAVYAAAAAIIDAFFAAGCDDDEASAAGDPAGDTARDAPSDATFDPAALFGARASAEARSLFTFGAT